jgi:hypothetical protein
VLIATLVAVGIVVAIVWDVTAAIAYGALALLAFGVVYALVVGGRMIERASRSRFEDRDRR